MHWCIGQQTGSRVVVVPAWRVWVWQSDTQVFHSFDHVRVRGCLCFSRHVFLVCLSTADVSPMFSVYVDRWIRSFTSDNSASQSYGQTYEGMPSNHATALQLACK
ncbi:hypothetical protein VTN49DRAFT_1244 [Thermomyces lanuginosus]|uniref:uncharacterized protein n=1 Tax=Thermomyces lanuginosus TaxID=5541 RepID=UPI0037429C44